MTPIQQLMLGTGAKKKTYMDDVFSTYLYKGNNSTLAINNGLDLASEGGMIWVKNRNRGNDPCIVDTARGIGKRIESNNNYAQDVYVTTKNISSFTSTGFTLGVDEGHDEFNRNGDSYSSWSFRKSPGFFDCFTFSGDNTTNRNISHNLGSLPGLIVIKRTDSAGDWHCATKYGSSNYGIGDNSNDFKLNSNSIPQVTRPFANIATSTTINVAKLSALSSAASGYDHTKTNASGATYVCYLWADCTNSDAEIFGENGNQGVIKCANYTGTASPLTINVGFEPQWLMIKRLDSQEPWFCWDSMRGIVEGGEDARLMLNSGSLESSTTDRVNLTSTGFTIPTSSGEVNGSGGDYVYLAIRRPDPLVQKPQLATDVFTMDVGNGSSSGPCFDSNFAVDFALRKIHGSTDDWWAVNRLTGKKYLKTNGYGVESNHNDNPMDFNDGWAEGSIGSGMQSWMWKRHAGFDCVTYGGNGSPGQQISHNLSKTPEMIWIKCRSHEGYWLIGHKGLDGGNEPWTHYLRLSETDAEEDNAGMFNDTAPTSTHFTLGDQAWVNGNTRKYVAMLFASVDGISKVGYYTGTSTDLDLNLGFTCRFIIIKRTDGAGDGWFVFDTLRGINGSNAGDPLLKLNSNAAQNSNTNHIEPITNGVKLKTGVSGTNYGPSEEYIYYAHA